ncbi:MAG TPA: F0F1 ATP synthase subunit gamma [Acidimicrobiales bacterium]|nr:F0F1 ATP synthase subunit gamma [Acidimicrobiales bacterium]
MPGGKERALRRQIRSVQSTKKITKAMELIAASRIARAQQRVAAARPYSERITDVIRNLAAAGAGGGSPLLEEREEVRTTAFVVVAADRGLSGAYNSSVIRAAERSMQRLRADGRGTRLVTVGKKAQSYFRFRGWDIDQAYVGMSDTPSYEDARRVAEDVVGRFVQGEYDRVELAYTQFLSAATQRVVVRRFVPLDTAILAEAGDGPAADYEFEPGPQEILDRLLPRYAEARLYAALLEGSASFFAAQQRAMKSATDNAEELIVKYSRAMNRARQDAITTEIMEIVGGAEAMRAAQADRSDLHVDHVLRTADVLVDSLNRTS